MPITQYIVRPAVMGDVSGVAALLDELNRYEEQDVMTDVAALTQALFGDDPDVNLQALVAETNDNHEIIAVLLYYPGYDTLSASVGYHLADVVVSEGWRAHGVGRAIFSALATQALQKSKQWISLTVLRKNMVAQKFYTAMGMTQIDVNFMAIGENALLKLTLEK